MTEDRAQAAVPFRLIDNRIFVEARINGEGPFAMIFDTGGANIVTPELAAQLGLELRDQFSMPGVGEAVQPAWRTHVREAALGDIRMSELDFTVLSLAPIQRAIGFERIDGLFGHELLLRYVVNIDYVRGELRFAETGQAPQTWFRGASVPFEFIGNLPGVAARLDGLELRAAIDTGDRFSLTLFGPFVDDHGLRANRPLLRAVTGWGVGGPVPADVGRWSHLELGDIVVRDVTTRMPLARSGVFASRLADASIGNGIMRRFDVTFDYGRQLVFLSPNASFDEPDRFDRSGMWLRMTDEGGFEIYDVTEGSPAARAGLRAGHEILAVDGAQAGALALIALRERIASPGASALHLRVRAGRGEREAVLSIPALE